MKSIKYVGCYSGVHIPALRLSFMRGVPVVVSDEVAAQFEYGCGDWSIVNENIKDVMLEDEPTRYARELSEGAALAQYVNVNNGASAEEE